MNYLIFSNKWALGAFLLLFCLRLQGQATVIGDLSFEKIPIDLQLVERLTNGKGTVNFKGEKINSSGIDKIEIKVYRHSSLFNQLSDLTSSYLYEEIEFNFVNGNTNFDIEVDIESELMNYSFAIKVDNSNLAQIFNVVAGDVFIIQGQSNAEARWRNGDSVYDYPENNVNKNFIRVYANATEWQSVLEANDNWYVADGDRAINGVGFIGQWGFKLSSLIVNDFSYPVAVFNGSKGGEEIAYYESDHDYTEDDVPGETNNNYQRLKYRLTKTELLSSPKALLWSQGESTGSFSDYESIFLGLKDSWNTDYGIEKIYIFQTRNGCGQDTESEIEKLTMIKEAQRKICLDDDDNYLMVTDGLQQNFDGGNLGYCHFVFKDGFEGFAERIYELIKRDIYLISPSPTDLEIEPPNIENAYLEDNTKLILETDAKQLSIETDFDPSFFKLYNAGSSIITGVSVDMNKIEIYLSIDPGSNPTISFNGVDEGLVDGSIINDNDLELSCFHKFPIDTSLKTIWDGSNWSPAEPVATMDADINGTYNESDGNIIARNLTVLSGKTVNFDNGGGNYIDVHGNLTIAGFMTIGDNESLVLANSGSSVSVTGSFTKKEKSTILKSRYDVTYWSSPVQSAILSTTFPGVDVNRIFEYDPDNINPAYTGAYQKYRHWHKTNGSMTPGKGYSVDGRTAMTVPEKMNVEFSGTPNHGNIPVMISRYGTTNFDYDKTNLLGNPYPAAIDADALITENTINNDVFEGTLYLWDHSENYVSGEYTAEYLTYNLGGAVPSNTVYPYHIASGQGFMILTDQSSAQFNFLSSMQVLGNNNDFYKSNNKKNIIKNNGNRIWLQISQEDIPKKEILLGFSEAATKNFDKGYDGKLLNTEGAVTFYSLIDSSKYVIQGLGSLERDRKVDIGFSASEIGNYSIGISKVDGKLRNQSVYLVDKVLNIWHDLSLGDYKFDQNKPGDFGDRFFIRFDDFSLEGDEIDTSPNFIITSFEGGYEVTSKNIIKKIELYNIMGQILYSDQGNLNHIHLSKLDLKIGTILLMNVTFENGTMKNKKVILF